MIKNDGKNLNNAKYGGFIFAFMICAYVVISFFGDVIILGLAKEKGLLYYAIGGIFAPLAIITVILFCNVKGKEPLLSTIRFNKFSPKYLYLPFLFSVGMFLGFGFVNTLISALFKKWGFNLVDFNLPLNDAKSLIVFCVIYALLPAVAEEAFFRGILYRNFENNNKLLTALTVSFLFAVYHCNVSQFVYQFIYGFGLTLIVIKTGSSLLCVISHLLNNLAVLLLNYFSVNVDLFNPVIIAIGILCFSLFMVLILDKTFFSGYDGESQKGDLKHFWLPYGIIGVGICIFLAVANLVA